MTVADKNQQVAGQNLIPTKCPNCGGFISFKKGGKVDCEYCGSSFMLNQAHLATNSKVRNLYELAYAAQEGNNVGDAHRYFTKILEEDTGEALAWYGKGTSALGMSTGANINSDEALVSFDKAAQYSDENEKANLNSEIGKTCNHYASLIYRWLSANGWLDQFNSDEVTRLWEEGDKYKEMDFKERKLFVESLCMHPYFPGFRQKIQTHTEKLRQLNKKYRNPLELASSRTTMLILITIVIFVGLVVLISLAASGTFN